MFQYQLERYSSWLPSNYTFHQLRQDACRYWKLRLSDVILEDADGCAWPNRVEVESLVSLPLAGGEPFIVHVALKEDSSSLLIDGQEEEQEELEESEEQRQSSASAASAASPVAYQGVEELEQQHPTTPSSVTTTQQHQQHHHHHQQQQQQPPPSAGLGAADLSGSGVESELWNIFSYYCVHGDAKEVQHLRRHHWLQLMRDIGLLGPTLGNSTPTALFRVIYQAETRGQVGSSGKMNYNEFLDALMNVAARACHPDPHRSAASPTMLEETDPRALDASFVDLLATYILPHVSIFFKELTHTHNTHAYSAEY